MLDRIEWAGVRRQVQQTDIMPFEEALSGLGLVCAVVVGDDDDLVVRRGRQVQELLEEGLGVVGVGPVRRHVDELPVVAAHNAVDRHTAASGGLHGQRYGFLGGAPRLPGRVPQVHGGLVHVVDLLVDLGAQQLHHEGPLLGPDLVGAAELVDAVQVHRPHPHAVADVVAAQRGPVERDPEPAADVVAPVGQGQAGVQLERGVLARISSA